jgi:predicted RNA-binding protein with PUA-like domain
MNYWMVKQEPEAYSWADFVKDGGTDWTGVRNFQARNNLRGMKKGDAVFFYHSVSEKQVVGMAKVWKEHFPDKTAEEGDWSAVTLKPWKRFKKPVSLEQMKKDPVLKDLPLIKQSRLSVLPVDEEQARRLQELGS